MKTNFFKDNFVTEAAFNITESSSDNLPKGILCIIKGDFFFPDGFSKNKRFYPSELWEKALSSKTIQKKLENRNLYGTISHEQEINDKALLEGKISHIVSKLEITPEGKGYGEIEILDTPAGKIMETLANAKCKMYVSTRGQGTFKGEKDGQPIVDPQTYILETVDFVLDPGFEKASPTLSEAYNELFNDKTNNGQIGEELMDKLLEKMQAQNEGLTKELKDLREKLEVTSGDLESIKKENDTLAKTNEALVAKKAILEKYEALGTPAELKTVLEKFEKIIPEYKSFKKLQDSPSDITEALEMAEAVISQYQELGKPNEIIKAFDVLEGFKSKVDEIGTLSEINKALDLLEKFAGEREESKKNEAISTLSKKLGIEESKIKKVYGKLSEEEIVEMFDGLSDDLEEFRQPITEAKKDKKDVKETFTPSFKKPLAQRLVEKHTGTITE